MALLGADGEENMRQESTGELGRIRSGPLSSVLGPLRIVSGIVLFALVVGTLARSWQHVRTDIGRMTPYEIALAQALVLAGLGASALTWRAALAELGEKPRFAVAAKIYLLGQLGKYVPGSFWALALQMELGTRARVPRATGMTASVLAIGVNIVTGLAIGLVLVPGVLGGGPARTAALAAVVAAGAIALVPPILTRILGFLLRIVQRTQAVRRIGWRGILTTTGWSLTSWASYGASIWILAVSLGAPAAGSLAFCFGGVALAMTAGFLVVVAPSGIGVREAVIVASLTPVLDGSEALAAALIARLLFTIGDLLAAMLVLPVQMRPVESG